jgi:hypothetical protein
MGRVNGKPKLVSERYLGSAEQIVAALAAQEAATLPQRTRHLAFGDIAAVWGMLNRLNLALRTKPPTRNRSVARAATTIVGNGDGPVRSSGAGPRWSGASATSSP